MEIDFTRLKYFLAVAEELHFKRAADRLHITPPPLSKQIKLLERELGGSLFERDYHHVRLTPLGEKLVEPARRILDQVAEFRATAESITGQPGPLRVGVTAYAPSDFFDTFESAITELALTASVFSIPGSAAEVAAELVAGHLDLGLIHLPPTDSRIDFRVIGQYRSGIAVRGDDPLAARALVRIEELRDREVAVDIARANPVIHAAIIRGLSKQGITRIVHATPSVPGSEIEMAAQIRNRRLVLLVSYAPDSLLARVFSPPEFKLVPIDETTWEPGRLAIAWARSPVRSHPALPEVVEQLAARFSAS